MQLQTNTTCVLRNGHIVRLFHGPHPDYIDYPFVGEYNSLHCRWTADGRWTLNAEAHDLDVVSIFGPLSTDIQITEPMTSNTHITEPMTATEEALVREAAGEAPAQHPKPYPSPRSNPKFQTTFGNGGNVVSWPELSKTAREFVTEHGGVVSIEDFDDAFAPFGVELRQRLERTWAYLSSEDCFGLAEIVRQAAAIPDLQHRIGTLSTQLRDSEAANHKLRSDARYLSEQLAGTRAVVSAVEEALDRPEVGPVPLTGYGDSAAGDILRLRRQVGELRGKLESVTGIVRAQKEQLGTLSRELSGSRTAHSQTAELHNMQLAAISTASAANTRESAKSQLLPPGSPYRTVAYDDVVRAVAREMKHREALEAERDKSPHFSRTLLQVREELLREKGTVAYLGQQIDLERRQNTDLSNKVEAQRVLLAKWGAVENALRSFPYMVERDSVVDVVLGLIARYGKA